MKYLVKVIRTTRQMDFVEVEANSAEGAEQAIIDGDIDPVYQWEDLEDINVTAQVVTPVKI